MTDYYRILGVSKNARPDEIRRAYRQLARQHHPDASGDSGNRFREIREAYETLRDAGRRRRYDERRPPDGDVVVARGGRQDWFADEVAIDFPSVHAVVDRIREAFFGFADAPVRHSAEVVLTPEEARRGVVVPLEVPVREACPFCDGRGEVWMDACDLCGGTGEGVFRHPMRLSIPCGVRHGTRVRFSVNLPSASAALVEIRVTIA